MANALDAFNLKPMQSALPPLTNLPAPTVTPLPALPVARSTGTPQTGSTGILGLPAAAPATNALPALSSLQSATTMPLPKVTLPTPNPQPTAPTTPTMNNLFGTLDMGKLGDPNYHTPKYDFLRFAQSRYPSTPEGLTAMVQDPQFQAQFPGAKQVGKDKIDFPGVGLIDVGPSFGAGGNQGWAWTVAADVPDGNGGWTVAPTQGTGAPAGSTSLQDILSQLTSLTNSQTATTPTIAPTTIPAGSATPTATAAATPSAFAPPNTASPVVMPTGILGLPTGVTPTTTSGQGLPALGIAPTVALPGDPNATGEGIPPVPIARGYDQGGLQNMQSALQALLQPQTGATAPTATTASSAPATGSTAAPTATGGFDLTNPGFDDPATVTLLQFLQQAIARLTAPIDDPAAANLTSTLQSAQADTEGDPYSAQDYAAIQAHAFDTLNRNEQAEIQNTIRELGTRGIPPSSGVVTQAVEDVKKRYDVQRAQTQQGLNQTAIDSANTRRAQRVSLAQAQATQTAQQRAETNANWNTATPLAQIPVELTMQRLSAALAAAGAGSGGESSASGILAQLAQLSQQASSQGAAAQQQFYQQLGALLAGLGS